MRQVLSVDRRFSEMNFRLSVVLVALLSIALRLYRIDHSFWLDEGYSQWFSALPLDVLWSDVPQYETHPPMYYTLLHEWRILFGGSEPALRSLSVLAGVATVILVCFAGRVAGMGRAFDASALIAAFLLSLNAGHIELSQTARPYALQTLSATLALLSLVRTMRIVARNAPADPRHDDASGLRMSLTILGVSSGVTLWLHNTSILIVFSFWAAAFGSFLTCRRDRLKAMSLALLAAGAMAALIWSPFVTTFIQQNTGNSNSAFWLTFSPKDVKIFVFTVAGGWPALVPVALFAAIGLVGLWKSDRTEAIAVAIGICLPVLIAIAVSVAWKPVFIVRLFQWTTPAVLLLCGAGITTAFRGRVRRLGAATFVCALLLPTLVQSAWLVREDWVAILAMVERHAQPGDLILAVPNELAVVLETYADRFPSLPKIAFVPGPFPFRDQKRTFVGNLGAPRVEPADAAIIEDLTRRSSRIWLVTRRDDLYDPQNVVRAAIRKLKHDETAFVSGYISVTLFQ